VYQTAWVAFITYLAWFWLVRTYPPSRLAAFTFLTPLFGVLAGSLLLNEPLTRRLLLALVLVGTGIYLVNRRSAHPAVKAAVQNGDPRP
jgi:drug/metabolite transporter (DMT)-like permease